SWQWYSQHSHQCLCRRSGKLEQSVCRNGHRCLQLYRWRRHLVSFRYRPAARGGLRYGDSESESSTAYCYAWSWHVGDFNGRGTDANTDTNANSDANTDTNTDTDTNANTCSFDNAIRWHSVRRHR